jgi:hypothetical protein
MKWLNYLFKQLKRVVVALFSLIPFLVTYREYSCMSLHIGPNAARDQGALGGEHSPSCAETNFSRSEQGKDQLQWLCTYIWEFYET